MNSTDLKWTACRRTVFMGLATLATGASALTGALAGESPPLPAHFSGTLNDYTPAVTGGPYEMHGRWSLQLNEPRRAATFSAEMSMETAGFANSDPNHDPTKLGPHTHHISVTNGVLHNDPTDPVNWNASCPKFKPAAAHGFVVTGTAYVTGNGSNPPFGNPSLVTICIVGGMHNLSVTATQALVEYSNFTLTFASGSLASSHFGAQAINGVVSRCDGPWREGWEGNHEANDCKVVIVE